MYIKLASRNHLLAVIFAFAVVYLVVIVTANTNHIKHRVRRKVVFSKSSKFFFRLNGKDNVINHTTIFAHGWAVRVNYDLPESIPKRHMFFKRDINSDLLQSDNQYIQPETSCLMNHICQMASRMDMSSTSNMLFHIARIITSSEGYEADFFKRLLDKCDYHSEACSQMVQHLTL